MTTLSDWLATRRAVAQAYLDQSRDEGEMALLLEYIGMMDAVTPVIEAAERRRLSVLGGRLVRVEAERDALYRIADLADSALMDWQQPGSESHLAGVMEQLQVVIAEYAGAYVGEGSE